MRTIEIAANAMLAGAGIIAFAIIKGEAIAVNGAVAFDRNV